MKNAFYHVAAAVLLVLSAGLSGCCNGSSSSSSSSSTCVQGGNIAFVAKFDSDNVGGPPSTTGLLGPSGAALQVEGNLEVVESPLLSTRAVRIERGSPDPTIINATVGGGPIAAGKAYVVFEGFGETIPSHLIAGMGISVRSSTGKAAASLKLFDGSYKVLEGSEQFEVAGSYDPTAVHKVVITLNVGAKVFSVCVNDSVLLADRPFASSEANDVQTVQFYLAPTITEAFPSAFVIDLIRVTT